LEVAPFAKSQDYGVSGDGESFERPAYIAALKRQVRVLSDNDKVQVAAYATTTRGVGAEVADSQKLGVMGDNGSDPGL